MQENKKIVFEGYSRRLDIFAADELADFSRAIVQKMIKDGKITVNGKKVKPSWPLTPGEVVEFEMPSPEAKTKLSDLIIHDGKDFFVLIKPAGMLVHPQSPVWEEHPEAVFSTEETLVSVILANPPKGFDTSMPRAGLVHRLDRETSGVMVVAKTQEFQAEMVALFSNREVHKTYHSIACGEVPDNEGTIDVPIGRVAGGKIKASDVGREAVTDYKVLERKNGNWATKPSTRKILYLAANEHASHNGFYYPKQKTATTGDRPGSSGYLLFREQYFKFGT